MKLLLSSLLAFFSLFQTSIYDISVMQITGGSLKLDSFRGKKILVVNIATGSDRVSQLSELQQLQQRFQDSLTIIAFPSNSFGNESLSDPEIKTYCEANYQTTFPLAAKSAVSDLDSSNLYHWLMNKTENGSADCNVTEDFQKFLINEQGNLIGIFPGNLSPLSYEIINSIQAH